MDGSVNPQDLIFGIKILWWGRIGKLLQFVSGLVIVTDLIGTDRIRSAEASTVDTFLRFQNFIFSSPNPGYSGERLGYILNIVSVRNGKKIYSFSALLWNFTIYLSHFTMWLSFLYIYVLLNISTLSLLNNVVVSLFLAIGSWLVLYLVEVLPKERQDEIFASMFPIGFIIGLIISGSLLITFFRSGNFEGFLDALHKIFFDAETREKFFNILALPAAIPFLLMARVFPFFLIIAMFAQISLTFLIFCVYKIALSPIIWIVESFTLERTLLLASLITFVMGFLLDFIAS